MKPGYIFTTTLRNGTVAEVNSSKRQSLAHSYTPRPSVYFLKAALIVEYSMIALMLLQYIDL